MNGVPLHPGIVHIPIALAFVIPLVALAYAFFAWRKPTTRGRMMVLVIAQALVVGSAWIAMETGEGEEEIVERVVPHDVIHEHEEAAETFLGASIGLLVVLGAAMLLAPRPKLGPPLVTVAALASFGPAYLAYDVGHKGGELVYVHGAANAYIEGGKSSGEAPEKKPAEGGESRGEGAHGYDDD